MFPTCKPIEFLRALADCHGNGAGQGAASSKARSALNIMADAIAEKDVPLVHLGCLAVCFEAIASEYQEFIGHVLEAVDNCPINCSLCSIYAKEMGWCSPNSRLSQ